MIREMHGDILATQAVALVNPVNTRGVMGAGLAKTLKQLYPDMFDQYARACFTGELTIGTVLAYHVPKSISGVVRHILCLPTKREWWLPSRIEYIQAGLVALREKLTDLEIPSVAIPALGCGLGGLQWKAVWPLVAAQLDGIEGLDVELYAPREAR
jgi:O-acetyl-ADP-ribose deacetylase (regulator of RNase III)